MGRSWKTDDWDFLNRLHKSGYIDDLVSRVRCPANRSGLMNNNAAISENSR